MSETPGKDPIFELCDVVRETAFDVHKWFRHGQFEKVYENSLANRLRKKGIDAVQQFHLPVFDEDGTLVGDYQADILVNRHLIVELKACRDITDEHIAQVLGYLRASHLEHGLLINFGAPKLQIKKLIFSLNRE
jgi:GxxExxY protein